MKNCSEGDRIISLFNFYTKTEDIVDTLSTYHIKYHKRVLSLPERYNYFLLKKLTLILKENDGVQGTLKLSQNAILLH